MGTSETVLLNLLPEQVAASAPADSAASATPTQANNWTNLVEKIKADDYGGMEDLYRVFSKGVRFYLCRQLGPQDLEDKVHDTFLIVVQAVRRGELREPERLMGFVRTGTRAARNTR